MHRAIGKLSFVGTLTFANTQPYKDRQVLEPLLGVLRKTGLPE